MLGILCDVCHQIGTQNIHSLIIKFRATNFTQLGWVGLEIQNLYYQTFHWITPANKAHKDELKTCLEVTN